MLGLRLFIHSVRMVFKNLIPMVQLFALPLCVVLAVLMAFSSYIGLGPFFFFSGQSVRFNNMSAEFMLVFFATFLVIWVALMNGVVHWHRFVLLSETPRALMLRLSWRQVAKYIIAGILIFLLLILPFLLLGMVAGKIALGIAITGNHLVAQGLLLAINLFCTAIFLSLSPILPANAIDQNLKISDALAAMSGSLGALLICAVGLAGMNWLFAEIAQFILPFSILVGQLVVVVLSALVAMIGVSLLTTIYGHFIEDRPLG